MQDANKGKAQKLDGSELIVGIVQARFNEDITNELANACTQRLVELGVQPSNIVHITVPGALEIPLALQTMAESENFDGLVAIGCVIRGETYHFELVANESAAGVTRVSLDYSIPIANAILTPENQAQAQVRQHEKGQDAAQVVVEMCNLVNDF